MPSQGQYTQASQFFRQSFETSQLADCLDTVESTRTEYGIGAAHELFERYTKFIVLNDKTANTRVMSWRDGRSQVRGSEEEVKDSESMEDSDGSDEIDRA